MTTTELRIKVAEAMGYKVVGEAWAWCPDGAWSVCADDEAACDYRTREVVALCPHFNPTHDDDSPHACGYPTHALEVVPNFGAPDWSATGAVLDEINRRGWGCHTSKMLPRLSSTHDCTITMDNGVVEATNPCRHRAICLAFLAANAHARAKEPK